MRVQDLRDALKGVRGDTEIRVAQPLRNGSRMMYCINKAEKDKDWFILKINGN